MTRREDFRASRYRNYVSAGKQTGTPLQRLRFAFSALYEVAMASVYTQEENSLSPYRKLLVDLSFDLSKRDIETLKLAGVDVIPRRMSESIATGLQFFDVLEQDGRIGPRNLNLLQDMLKTVGRLDLAWKIREFLTTSANSGTDGKIRSLNTISIKQEIKIL